MKKKTLLLSLAIFLLFPFLQVEAKAKEKKKEWKKNLLAQVLSQSPGLSPNLQKLLKAEISAFQGESGRSWRENLTLLQSRILKKITKTEPDFLTERKKPFVRSYWVGDLLFNSANHPAPRLNGEPLKTENQPGLYPNKADSTLSGYISAEKLVELCTKLVGENSGDLSLLNSYLWVKKSLPDHHKIVRFLDRLRNISPPFLHFRATLLEMSLKTYLSYFGQSSPILTAQQERGIQNLKKKGQIKILKSYHFRAGNSQVVNVQQGFFRLIVADYIPDSAGVLPVLNPEIHQLFEGFIGQFRPILTMDGRHIWLDMSLRKSKIGPIRRVQFKQVGEIQAPSIGHFNYNGAFQMPLGKTFFWGGSASGKKGIFFLFRAEIQKRALRTNPPEKKIPLLAQYKQLHQRIQDLLEAPKTEKLQFYSIQELIWKAPDYPAPRLSLFPINSSQKITKSGGGGGLSLGDDEEESFSTTPDQLIDMIRESVGEDLFSDEENTGIEYHAGQLIVSQGEKTQKKIRKFLQKWREKKPKTIGLTTIFLNGSALNLHELAKKNSWILSPKQTKNLLKIIQIKRNALSSLQRMTLRSGQKIFLYSGTRQKYLSSYEMVSAGTNNLAQKLADPMMAVLSEGFLISGSCTFGKGAFRLDFTCVNSRLKKMDFLQTKYGNLELPQMDWQKLQGNLNIPQGSSALFGGSAGGTVVWVIPELVAGN